MNIRRYQSSDCDKVVDLLNLCFSKKDITRKSFIWKHFDPFFHSEELATVAQENGEILSFVCFVPSDIVGLNKRVRFYSCAIQATHPHHRRKGLVTSSTRMIEQILGNDVQYYGFSNTSGVMIDKYSKQIAYSIVGQLVSAYIPASVGTSRYHVLEVVDIPESFLKKIRVTFFAHYKSHAYLEWRYVKHPKQKYVFFQIHVATRVLGYVVAKISGVKFEIYDILADDDPEIFRDIIMTMKSYIFRKGKIFLTMSYLPNQFWKSALTMLHVTRTTDVYFTLKSNRVPIAEDKWLIQRGDIL